MAIDVRKSIDCSESTLSFFLSFSLSRLPSLLLSLFRMSSKFLRLLFSQKQSVRNFYQPLALQSLPNNLTSELENQVQRLKKFSQTSKQFKKPNQPDPVVTETGSRIFLSRIDITKMSGVIEFDGP